MVSVGCVVHGCGCCLGAGYWAAVIFVAEANFVVDIVLNDYSIVGLDCVAVSLCCRCVVVGCGVDLGAVNWAAVCIAA